MNTGLKWIKDTNSYNAHTDKLVDMVGSTNSTVSAIRLRSVSEDESQESIAYLPDVGELRSLPNGVKDEVNVGLGKKTQRVSDDYVLQSADIVSLITTPTNVDYIMLNKPIGIIDAASNQFGRLVIHGYSEYKGLAGERDSIQNAGKFYYNGSLSFNPTIIVEKGMYADLTSAKNGLAGTTLTYQLAEPIEYAIPDAEIVCYPSGTISIESEAIDAGESTIPTLIVRPPAGLLLPITIENKEYFEPTYLDQDFILL